jgi:hypothetical protein
MRLFHFTCEQHWDGIFDAKCIRPSESNVGSPAPHHRPFGERIGPDVVWLLDTDQLAFPHGLAGSIFDKTRVCIEVNVPAIRWLDWAPAASMDSRWRQMLINIGGGPAAAQHWYVWPASIPGSNIVSFRVNNKERV